MTEANWNKVQLQVHDILSFTQTLGYLHCFDPKDTQLLLEPITKHYLWNTTIPFESKDLELTTVLKERLKQRKVHQLTEPHCVLREWGNIMSFMLCGQHLLLPVVQGQFEDPPIAIDLKNKTEGTLLRHQPDNIPHQKSTQDHKLASCQKITSWNMPLILVMLTTEETMRI